jgi:hypothetical protein
MEESDMHENTYYGRVETPNIKHNIVDHILQENNYMILNALKEMEERIKGHAMECKRLMMHEIKKQGCKCKSKKEISPAPQSIDADLNILLV